MKMNILVLFYFLAVSYGSPLPACGCQTYPCDQESYPYAINGGQTPEEDPTVYDVKVRPNSGYSYEESNYQYLSNVEDSSEGQGAYGGQPNPSRYPLDQSQQNAPQQSTHRSVTLTWRFQGGSDNQLGNQRPQGQDQRQWNPEQISQPRPGKQRPSNSPMMYGHEGTQQRPAVQPTRPQRPSMRVSVYGNDEDLQDQRSPHARPISRPRHRSSGNSWESEGGNQYGGMTGMPRHPVQTLPCPYNGC
ncbi:hypothetical protein ACTXT7_015658 [Hymenolepis weldensis]